MLLVVDANVIFSSLIARGKPFEVFEANKMFGVFRFVAPEFLFMEIGRRADRILSQTNLAKEDLSEIFSFIKGEIKFVSLSEFSDKMPEAKKLNFKDSPYLALALKLSCPILSGDKGLKRQSAVKVLSPSEALEVIYGLKPHP